MSNTYYERTEIIGKTAGYRESMLAREENKQIDKRLEKQRKTWRILPPEKMLLSYQGLIVSVPHEIGRELIRRREAAILEHPVTVDVVIEGTIEDFLETELVAA